MIRYTLGIDTRGSPEQRSPEDQEYTFRTNTHEYSPTTGPHAQTVIWERLEQWELALRERPRRFLAALRRMNQPRCLPPVPVVDVVVLQGSPRADGNGSILAGWGGGGGACLQWHRRGALAR